MTEATLARAAFALALLLGALGTVTWRQSRSLETLADLDRLGREASVARAERIELDREIQGLERRARVVSVARDRLGMRMPEASELVILRREPVS